MPAIIGIDLGTTNSVLAYIDEVGRPQIHRNLLRENLTPSIVAFEDGETYVGTPAKRMKDEGRRSRWPSGMKMCSHVSQVGGVRSLYMFSVLRDYKVLPDLLCRPYRALGFIVDQVPRALPSYVFSVLWLAQLRFLGTFGSSDASKGPAAQK